METESALSGPSWTPDGSHLVFAKRGSATNDEWQIMQVPSKGGPAVFTGLTVTGLGLFDLSPDGSRIAFDGTGYSLSPPAVKGEETEIEIMQRTTMIIGALPLLSAGIYAAGSQRAAHV